MNSFDLPPLPSRIRNFRKARGWTQLQLSAAVQVSQSQVSHWERGEDRPSPAALAAIAKLADETERTLWIVEAGLAGFMEVENVEMRSVPVMQDPATAGTPAAVDEDAIAEYLSFPTSVLRPGGKLYALRVVGHSMAPVVNDGYLVIVDVAANDPALLGGRMVAARDGAGVSIKWLRRDGDVHILVPNRQSVDYPIRILKAKGNHSLIGEVITIIGHPPTEEDKGE